LPKGEFAFGNFYENDVRKWCLFLDADDEYIDAQLFCFNLEKKLIGQGYERKEWSIGENTRHQNVAIPFSTRASSSNPGGLDLLLNSVEWSYTCIVKEIEELAPLGLWRRFP
jgi:hypothetical protein